MNDLQKTPRLDRLFNARSRFYRVRQDLQLALAHCQFGCEAWPQPLPTWLVAAENSLETAILATDEAIERMNAIEAQRRTS